MAADSGALERVDVEPVHSRRHAHQLRARLQQHILQTRVDWVFHDHRITGTHHHPRDQVERLLATIGNDEIVAGPHHAFAARLVQQVMAQRRVTGGRPQLQHRRRVGRGQHFLAASTECFNRKQVLGRARVGEADAVWRSGRGQRKSRRRKQLLPVQTRAGRAHLAENEAAPSDVAPDQSFRFQKGISGGNGGPVQSKRASQFPSGWQPLPSFQTADSNQFFN